MKKRNLVLLTFVPVLVGYLINLVLFVPVVGMLFLYIVPLFVMVFWFYLGSEYSKTDWNVTSSVLIGNLIGILSLVLYLWQFLGKSDETRNMILAGVSQMYSAAIPGYLFAARLAVLFEAQPNYVGRTTMVAMQVISLIFMIAIFTVGYFWGKKHQKKIHRTQ